MRILRATHFGLCYGVRNAIQMAFDHARREPFTLLGPLVHNPSVISRLAAAGIAQADEPAAIQTAAVMITAHGTSERVKTALTHRGHRVLEATCPFVRHAHDVLLALARAGFHPVVIGQRQHVEVRGLTGDLDAFDVLLDDNDVDRLSPHPRFGVIAQTTQPRERVHRLLDRLRRRFPDSEVRYTDTVCRATQDRQEAAVGLSRQCDVVVVVGGAQSNNTRELAATCRQHCPRVHSVETAADLCASWFDRAGRVGITAGTSTPDDVIDAVEQRLLSWAPQLRSAPPEPALAHADAASADLVLA
jgi:4-hydroxy-3-methylbut-2-enyl diphosphate reductase